MVLHIFKRNSSVCVYAQAVCARAVHEGTSPICIIALSQWNTKSHKGISLGGNKIRKGKSCFKNSQQAKNIVLVEFIL